MRRQHILTPNGSGKPALGRGALIIADHRHGFLLAEDLDLPSMGASVIRESGMEAITGIRIEEHGEVVVVCVDPKDCAGLWKVIEPIQRQDKRWFVLDFAGIKALNSMNIAAIIAMRHRLVMGGGKLALANLDPHLRQVFGVLRLERLFDLTLTLDEALVRVRQ